MSLPGRRPRTLTRQVVIAGVVLGLLQAGIFALLIGAVQASDRANREVNQILGAVEAVSDLERLVVDAQSGERGFVISGQERFLAQAEGAKQQIPRQEQIVRDGLLKDDERRTFAPLTRDIQSYITGWLDRVNAAARRSPAEARQLVGTGEGVQRFNVIRAQFLAIRRGLAVDADRSERTARAAVRRAVAIGAAGIFLAALLFSLYTAYVTRSVVIPVRRVAATARRLAGGERAARVRGADGARGEIGAMARSFNQMADSMEQSHDELEAQQRELAGYAEELEVQRGELERTVGELEGEKARIEMISVFSEAVTAETAFAPLAHLILHGVGDALRCDAGTLYVRDARREGDLALATTRGLDAAQLPEILVPGDGLAGRAVVELRPVVGSPGADARTLRMLTGPVPFGQELHVPLMQGGEVFGVLSLGRLADVPFEQGDLMLASHLADQSSVALSKAVVLRELRRRESITRAVLDATPNAIAVLDDTDHPVLTNEPMRLSLPLLRERPVPEVDGGIVRDEIQDPRTGRLFTRYVARLDEREVGLHGRLVVLSDVTAEREAERMKDEFFALVSHELRTPLTSIVGYLELLDDEAHANGGDPAAEQRRQFLGTIDRNARRLLRLVGDLLFVAQVEAGKLGLQEGDVELDAVAREAVEAAAPRAAAGGVELTLETEPVPLLRGDRDRLAQALDNLVSNAIKFTPAGGRVSVRLRSEEDRAVLEVADTGIGIPQADLQRLFQRFFRTKRATSAAIPGVGLGLTIAQAIVHSHEGQISVTSEEGRGTTFRIALPLHRAVEVTA
jgi:signal transduction histidine kinase/CHASE3 domain sensor protein